MTARLLRAEGATLVEFAVLAPLLLLLIFGIIDFGRFVATTSTVTAASRESARYGLSTGLSSNAVPRYTDCDEITAAGVDSAVMVTLDPARFTIDYDRGPGTAIFTTCPGGGPNPDPTSFTAGDRVIVTVSHEFTFISPFIGLFGPFTLESTDRRTLLST